MNDQEQKESYMEAFAKVVKANAEEFGISYNIIATLPGMEGVLQTGNLHIPHSCGDDTCEMETTPDPQFAITTQELLNLLEAQIVQVVDISMESLGSGGTKALIVAGIGRLESNETVKGMPEGLSDLINTIMSESEGSDKANITVESLMASLTARIRRRHQEE